MLRLILATILFSSFASNALAQFIQSPDIGMYKYSGANFSNVHFREFRLKAHGFQPLHSLEMDEFGRVSRPLYVARESINSGKDASNFWNKNPIAKAQREAQRIQDLEFTRITFTITNGLRFIPLFLPSLCLEKIACYKG